MNLLDLLNENKGPSNQIVNAILVNSGLSDSNRVEEYTQKIKVAFPKFRQIQNQLSFKLSQVRTFLDQFDGRHGSTKFKGTDERDLKDITKYTLQQLEFLVDEWDEGVTATEDRELLTKTQYTDDMAEVSKKLWYDEGSAKINLPGFRVYQPMNQADAIKYGWYEQKLMNEIRPDWHAWCITWRTGTNRWGSYRSAGGTFYFIIDESKLESDDIGVKKYYLAALQVIDKNKKPNHPTGYEVTDIRNPGEVEMTWDEIIAKYPQLEDYKDELGILPFSNDELQIQSVVGMMNDDPTSPNWFGRAARKYKEQYINQLQKIKTPESWYRMDKALRKAYITLSPATDFRNRFPNFELLRAIKDTKDMGLLNAEMIRKNIPEGVKELSMYLYGDLRTKTKRKGMVNDQISLTVTKDRNYGLWDEVENTWLVRNNDEYSPSYRKVESKVIENPTTKDRFFTDKFESADGDYFMAITPIPDINSYFLSKNAWESIKDRFIENPSEQIIYKTQDINEE